MELPISNPDILHRILEFLGPRSTCLTIGSTNRSLRQLVVVSSQSDSLWRIFWMRRCLFDDDHDGCVPNDDLLHCDNGGGGVLHKAALTFRHAIGSLNLESKLFFAATNTPTHQLQESEGGDDTTTTPCSSLYAGYIQTHSMMKRTNLRPVKIINNDERQQHDDAQNYQLHQQLCTQTWPGQLSLLNERLLQPPHGNNNNNNDGTTNNQLNNNNTVVTCLNSAEIWCDYPTCKQARCGPQGCLRCYRFLTPPVQRLQQQQQGRMNRISNDLDGPGDILGSWRECTERNYDLVSFVRCGWCSVSLCNDHIIDMMCNNNTTIINDGNDGNGRRRRSRSSRGRESAVNNSICWYKCDECNLSSCPQCISQVFLIQPPQMCHVVTAGKKCGRQICSNCIWAVGKEGGDDGYNNESSNNIPGGKISNDECCSEVVVSIRARDDNGRRRIELLKEKEYCCSKCLRHVEFRWRELSAVFDMFGVSSMRKLMMIVCCC